MVNVPIAALVHSFVAVLVFGIYVGYHLCSELNDDEEDDNDDEKDDDRKDH